ncbi:hypothetical protein BDD12DRAFT_726571 [Trichophaea hybrida]|nr:hypothetical protein BDD12DRAFT_726571 [Trichophaea hybrida]
MQNHPTPPAILSPPTPDTPKPSPTASLHRAFAQSHSSLQSSLRQSTPPSPYPLHPQSQQSQQQYPHPPLASQSHSVPPSPGQLSPPTTVSASLKLSHDHKRPRACESCRSLKVKCELSDKAGPSCRRCAKANRECIFTAPIRKRQKKADSKVAELESKIDALTARLNATRQGKAHHSDEDDDEDEDMETASSSEHHARSPDGLRHQNKFQRVSGSSGYDDEKNLDRREFQDDMQQFLPHGTKIAIPSGDNPTLPYLQYIDVIDQQLLSLDMATELFDLFKEQIAPHFPAIVVPPEATASEIRRTKPTLFLAILAASSGRSHPDLRRALQKETAKAYADRIMVKSEKSLELVQALLLTSIYYYPPDVYEELSFYIIIHMAASMALDLGLGRKPNYNFKALQIREPIPPTANFGHPLGKNFDWPRPKNPFPDPTTIESRRTFLGCFWACSNVAIALRRPNMLKFTSFMRESVEILETSPLAAPSDKEFCQWIKLQLIADELAVKFELDDPSSDISIEDPRMQLAIRGFARRLQEWRQTVDPAVLTKSLELNYYLLTIYAHEIALHVDHNIEDFRPPFVERLVREPMLKHNAPIASYHLSSISACVGASQHLVDTFCTYSIEDLSCIPIIMYVRCGYACMILIKVSATAATPGNELSKAIDKNELRVEEYVNRALKLLAYAAKGDRNRTAAKFAMILIMLRSWYLRHLADLETREQQQDDDTPMLSTEIPSTPQESQKAEVPPTPLHLLAEQATYQQPLQQEYTADMGFHGYLPTDVVDAMGFVEFQAGDVGLGFGGAGGEAFTDDSFWGMMGPGVGWPGVGEGWGGY